METLRQQIERIVSQHSNFESEYDEPFYESNECIEYLISNDPSVFVSFDLREYTNEEIIQMFQEALY